MEEVKYKRWTLEVDVAATRSAYCLVERGGPEDCGCQNCLNFAAARENVYPQEVLTLFAKLGVDCTKEAEVVYLAKEMMAFLSTKDGCISSGISSRVRIQLRSLGETTTADSTNSI